MENLKYFFALCAVSILVMMIAFNWLTLLPRTFLMYFLAILLAAAVYGLFRLLARIERLEQRIDELTDQPTTEKTEDS